jgi:hypothetical protein
VRCSRALLSHDSADPKRRDFADVFHPSHLLTPHPPLCYRWIRSLRAGAAIAPVARIETVWELEIPGSDVRILRMSQQPELTPHPLPASPAPGPDSALAAARLAPASDPASLSHAHQHNPQRIPRWLERSELFLRVLLRMYIGLAVCVAPWWPLFWDQNPLFVQFPSLAIFAANGAVRGVVSGLGC